MQNKGYHGVQGHSRSSRSVLFESPYICDFLLVINSNWHLISYRFGVIAAYCANFGHCVFEPPPLFGGLGTPYDVHLGLIGKRVVDFLLMLFELFFAKCYGWGATSFHLLFSQVIVTCRIITQSWQWAAARTTYTLDNIHVAVRFERKYNFCCYAYLTQLGHRLIWISWCSLISSETGHFCFLMRVYVRSHYC